MLDLYKSQYPALHDLITSLEDLDNVLHACDTQDHKDRNVIYITLDTFEVEHTVQKLDSGLHRDSN